MLGFKFLVRYLWRNWAGGFWESFPHIFRFSWWVTLLFFSLPIACKWDNCTFRILDFILVEWTEKLKAVKIPDFFFKADHGTQISGQKIIFGCMFVLHPKVCFTNKKNSHQLQMGNGNNIQSLQGGQDEKISIAHFLLTCQEKKKKGKFFKKPNLSLRVKWRGFNLQLTTTMHKWGQVQKREKSIPWHTNPNCMSSFPPSPPLTQVVFDYTPLEFPPDSATTHPNPFPQSVLFFLSTSWLEIIPENNLADQCTDLYIVCLSVFLASSLPFGFSWGGSDGRFWIRVVKSSSQFACIFVQHFQFCWLWTKHDGNLNFVQREE